jgi:hydrogenase maturation protein HypF
MVPDIETARQLCLVSSAEEDLLRSRRRPIVLLAKRPACPVADEVAPSSNTLGLILPYTPLHVLLLEAFAAKKPKGQPAALVMTSGNLSEEPITYRDDDALERLAPIVDVWLVHNREIHIRCDDSVIRQVAGGEQLFRRSRGYAPEPIRLEQNFPVPVLACGGHLKNTFCLGREKQAFVSHHIGDLENLETLASYKAAIAHYQKLFGIEAQAIVYDLHPEYLATKYALESEITPKIGVQHHHAHIASVMAEHGLNGPVIGVAADGTGYGTDGAIWGGEILLSDLISFERLMHLAYVPLPGGERAIRQPWRMAAVYLQQAYGDDFLKLDIPFVRQLDQKKWSAIKQMIQAGVNCPPTSSLGRLFDAVAALVGLRTEVQYEGQAAIELEVQAVPAENGYPFEMQEDGLLDVRLMMRAIVEDLVKGISISEISGHFHRAVAHMLMNACQIARKKTGVTDIALSGGVFQNRLLLEQVLLLLEADGFKVYINRLVPPNDGGLSLGQAAIAAARLAQVAQPSTQWQGENYAIQGSNFATMKRS